MQEYPEPLSLALENSQGVQFHHHLNQVVLRQ
jgi:hypothetical protein